MLFRSTCFLKFCANSVDLVPFCVSKHSAVLHPQPMEVLKMLKSRIWKEGGESLSAINSEQGNGIDITLH